MIEQYLSDLTAFRRPKTVEAYAYAVRKFEAFTAGQTLGPNSLVDFARVQLTSQGMSPRTVHLLVVGATNYLNWRKKHGEPLPEFERPPMPRPKKKVKDVLRGAVLAAYMDACEGIMPEPVRTLSRILPLTGLRISEACLLTANCLRPNGATWVFKVMDSKGDDREVPMLPAGNRILRVYLRDTRPGLMEARDRQPLEQYVFPNQLGGRCRAVVVRGWLNKVRKHIDVPKLNPHLLRHTFATILEEAGVPSLTIMAILGHKSLTTTKGYTHTSIDSLVRTITAVPTPWAKP